MEQRADYNANTTVAVGGYTAGSGVLNVVSTALPFPQSGTFTVVLQDLSTGAAVVLLRVLSINSSTQWTVVAEFSDANAVAGDFVYAVDSKSAQLQTINDINAFGGYDDLPTIVSPAGYTYKCTDQVYTFKSNGSIWVPFVNGNLVSIPPNASLFATAGSSVSLVSSKGALILTGATGGWVSALIAAPSVPFALEANFAYLVPGGTAAGIGICHSDGTKYKFFSYGGNNIALQYNTTLNGSSSNPLVQNTTGPLFPDGLTYKIILDGTHRTYYVGDGYDYIQIYQEAATQDLTTSQIGLVLYGGNSTLAATMKCTNFKYYNIASVSDTLTFSDAVTHS